MMLQSVRVRLALWHTGLLGLGLVTFSLATYVFLRDMAEEHTRSALQQAVSTFYHAFIADLHGERTMVAAAQQGAMKFRFSGRRVLMYDRHHQLVAISDSATDALTRVISRVEDADGSPLHPLFARLVPGASAYEMVDYGYGHRAPAFATRVSVEGEPFTVVAVQLGPGYGWSVQTFLRATIVAIPIALALAFGGGYFLARQSLMPVVQMSRQASAISHDNLHERLYIRNADDELGQLGRAFNGLLARLDEAFARQRQFFADASHELRTPVASLRAEIDVAISRTRSAEAYRASLRHIRREARRLSSVVDDISILAFLDASEEPPGMGEFYLEEIALDAARQLRPLAAKNGLRIECAPETEARCVGDAKLVQRVLANLIHNAIKHTEEGGRITIDVGTGNGVHEVRVTDTGVGIPDRIRDRVFDRFARGDAARTRGTGGRGGAGLGLAIARSIARAHGGSLTLAHTGADGTTFVLRLPAAPVMRPQVEASPSPASFPSVGTAAHG